MDDLTLGGRISPVAADVTTISSEGIKYGLQLDSSNCKAITSCGLTAHNALDDFLQFTADTATLLGASLSTGQAMTDCLTTRCNDLCRAVERLQLISSQDALVLLKNSLSAPKLQYTLRTACCEGHNLLTSFDNLLRSALCSTCNVTLSDQQWLQVSLPVRVGGLGTFSLLGFCCGHS
jgi:hypothetical protein